MLFKQVHLAQNPIWNKYYMDIFPKWEEEAKEQMVALNKAAAGIIRNPYQAGEALQPAKHQAIFLGREDLRAQFEFEIRHAEQLPLFLIQGQRRVGKTSLLNFLQDILGTGYCVIRQDLQSTADMQNMQVWMSSLRQKVNHAFNIQEADTWQPTDDWLASLEWSGSQVFHKQPRLPWTDNGELLGHFRSTGNLTQVLVNGAGHLVPMDQPKSALKMLDIFLNKKRF